MWKKLFCLAAIMAVAFGLNAQTPGFTRGGSPLPFITTAQSNYTLSIDRGGGLSPANITLTNLQSFILKKFGTNVSASPYAHKYPNFTNIIIGTNAFNGGTDTFGGGSIAVPNDFALYDRVGNYIWFWPSHSAQDTTSVPTDPMLRIQGGRDITIAPGPNGNAQLGTTGTGNQQFYLQYNETNAPSHQLQWRSKNTSGDLATSGIYGYHTDEDASGSGSLRLQTKSATPNASGSGYSDAGVTLVDFIPGIMKVFGDTSATNITYTRSLTSSNGIAIGSHPSGGGYVNGIDMTWGVYNAITLGGDFAASTRTSGQEKYSGVVLVPKTAGNPDIMLFLTYTAGSGSIINYGGGTATRGPVTDHQFHAGSSSTSVSAGNLQLRIQDGTTTVSSARFVVSAPTVPSTASSTGTAGTIAWDSGFIYVCTAANTWKRVAIATW